MPLYAGIEIGGTKLQLVAGDETGRIIQRRKFAVEPAKGAAAILGQIQRAMLDLTRANNIESVGVGFGGPVDWKAARICRDRKSTRLNSSHMSISYAVFCLKKKKIDYKNSLFLKKRKNRMMIDYL